jgi:hypothetical protein
MAPATKAKPRGSAATRRRKTKRAAATKRWKSRAVLRRIEAGSSVNCVGCEDHIKFSAKNKVNQVICNVYRKGAWVRVEHFHEACYSQADQPYGQPED